MVRRIAISICLFIFASSSSFVAAEPSTNFQEDSQTSFYSDEDSSADANRARRTFKRSARGKSSLKSLPSLNTSPRTISLAVYLRETSFIPPLSKASVYQKINVYRI